MGDGQAVAAALHSLLRSMVFYSTAPPAGLLRRRSIDKQ